MKLLKIVFFFSVFIGFKQVNAQNQASKSTDASTQNASWPAAEKPYVTPPINENDQYMGRAEEFLYIMVVNKLPADFPKYEKGMGLRYYNNLIDNYFLIHSDLLKEKWRQKVNHGQQ